MCGIAGIVDLAGAGPIATETALAMRETLAHRGPDDAGIWISAERDVALVHRRLSIIDLSAEGRQPMATARERYHVVFNGEIYNYRELRTELEQQRVALHSTSDTEVLLELYAREGPAMLRRLRGMFAIAIWDATERRLWLARDRIGVKPLYYAMHGGRFYFASEIKAILSIPGFPRGVCPTALYHFLTFLTSPGPETLFDGVSKLAAGHTLTLDRDGSIHGQEYWDVFDAVPSASSAAPAAELLEQLRTSVRYRMVSDVPFGVFLSGGIDSSVNVALMSQLADRPVETFSIGFDGPEKYTEFPFARLVATAYGARHHECRIGLPDLLEFLPRLIYHQDEPIADPVCVPLFYVARLAKENGVTVCHVGEGADELFGGYPYWRLMLAVERRAGWLAHLPAPVRRALPALLRMATGPGSHKYEVLRRVTSGEIMFWGGAEAFSEEQKRQILSDDVLAEVHGLNSHDVIADHHRKFLSRSPRPDDALGWMSYLDLRLRLPELLLMRVDKMTMATGVEARVPFLDHELVGFAMGLPGDVKMPKGELKGLLKAAVGSLLPEQILNRPKQGFGVPMTEWLLEGLGDVAERATHEFAATAGILRRDYRTHFRVAETPARTWYLLNLALWHRYWIERKPVEPLIAEVVGAEALAS